MRRLFALAPVLFALLLTTAYTPRTEAAHRYGWDDRYYEAGTYCWSSLTEVGRDSWPCDGPHNVSGNLSAGYKVTLVIECSAHQIVENQLYENCGSDNWVETSDTCQFHC